MTKTNPGFTRSLPTVTRADQKAPTISGLGAVYYREGDEGSQFWLWDDVVERIRPGAFAKALQSDVRSFFNHNPDRILGRTSAGTLTLSLTAEGLAYTVTPPDTEEGRSVLTAVDRRDVTGSSFMFLPVRTVWEEIKREGEPRLYVRWLEEVETIELGPVTFPAYVSTTATVERSADADSNQSRYEKWLATHVSGARSQWSQQFGGRDQRIDRRARDMARRAAAWPLAQG